MIKCDFCGDPVEKYLLQDYKQVLAVCYFCHKYDTSHIRISNSTKSLYKEITLEEYLKYKKLEVFK